MRAIIATDFGGHLRKLIWLTENRTGVSAGICDRIPNPHATYHQDDTYHYKVTSKGCVLKVFPKKRTPLRAISTMEELFGTATFYVHDIMTRLPRFSPNRRVDALVVLGQSVFSDIACASFSICIIHRAYEAKFITEAYSSYEGGSFMVVAVSLFALHEFTEHQLGVIIYKGRK
jgi:hypothetical protein